MMIFENNFDFKKVLFSSVKFTGQAKECISINQLLFFKKPG